jgi:multidrug efflux pump subunit AcrB
MESVIRWFSRNHVAANLLMLLVMVGGLGAWFEMKKEIFPETSIDAINIRIPYPNATPEEVEKGAVIPVEEAVADVEGVKKISSTSAENYGVVTVEVETGYSVREIMDDLKTRIDAVDNFAENAERPELEEIKIKAEVMSVAVTAATDEASLRKIAEDVRDGLLDYQAPPPEGFGGKLARLLGSEPSITQVSLVGVRPYEISIEVPEDTLRSYGLTFDEVAAAVRRSSVDLPGGSVRSDGGETLIRATGRRYTAREFEDIVVLTRADGSEVRVRDVSEVIDGFEDVDLDSRYDGRQAVVVKVFRVGNEDTLQVAAAVRDYVARANQTLPPGVRLEIWNDNSLYLKGRMDLLRRNGLLGFALVLGVLALFLRPSLALFVAIGIPAAFAGALYMMPVLGVSINMISLFAFIMVLGIVVDDALVTGENVYTRIQSGEHPREAAWKGTHEVGVVVTFGVLTTMAAFTPMLGLSGVSGKIWPNIPLVVIPTLFFSLIQSRFVLPAHLAMLRPESATRRGPVTRMLAAVDGGLKWFVRRLYQPLLGLAVQFRYATLAVFLSILALTVGLVGSGLIKTEFFPQVEADILSAKLTMPRGAAYADTVAGVAQMEAAARELNRLFQDDEGNPIIVHMLATAGSHPFLTGFNPEGPPTAANLGEVTLELRPAASRSIKANELSAKWRELTGPIPGAVELTFQALAAGGGNAIDLELSGPNLAELAAATAHVKDGLGQFRGVTDIADSNLAGKRELKLTGLTAEGKALGLRLEDVARQLRQGFYGDEAQRLQRGRDEVKVMVRYPRAERSTVGDVEQVKIRLADGTEVPLATVAEFESGRGFSVIQRADRRRAIRITADVDKSVPGANANEIVTGFTTNVLEPLRESFPGVSWRYQGEQDDQRRSMRELTVGAVFALFAIYALLAIPLRSYFQPVIIMSVIPFGVIGAILAHFALGLELSIMTMCGVIALAGIVVNNGLVMVDYVNRHRIEGHSLHDSALLAGGARFRAILLTSLTTVVGLAPMVFETDIQARFLIPMAVALAGGVAFATVITLLLVPCLYIILEDLKFLLFTEDKRQTIDAGFRRLHRGDAHHHELGDGSDPLER